MKKQAWLNRRVSENIVDTRTEEGAKVHDRALRKDKMDKDQKENTKMRSKTPIARQKDDLTTLVDHYHNKPLQMARRSTHLRMMETQVTPGKWETKENK